MKQRTLRDDDQLIPYQIQHKRTVTRRIHLRVAPDGSLLVIAPRRMSQRSIHQTLQDRVHKVARFLAGAQVRLRETPRSEYVSGEPHLFLGRHYRLELAESTARSGRVGLTDDAIRVECADHRPVRVQKLLESWYRNEAKNLYAARLAAIASRAQWVKSELPPIRLRKMKRTWGSCSARGIITLNTRLIRTPLECVDYVIAHELCHLQEMNHSRAFYKLQDQLCPDWQTTRTHLRKKAHIYLAE
mgnify:CR=1 FL=1